MDRKYPIEAAVLKDGYKRGMDILKDHLSERYLEDAAKFICSLEKGTVFLTTGFFVNGAAETDGPPGTYFLAHALKAMGFNPVILTDQFCEDFFDSEIHGPITTHVLSLEDDLCEPEIDRLVESYQPVLTIAIERCGRQQEGDYCNMRGVSIKKHTAPIDSLFIKYAEIPSIGIGDGGNEIGMGNLEDVINKELSDIKPSTVKVDHLLIGTVSNWAAYGLIAYLSAINSAVKLPPFEAIADYLHYINSLGAVDGVLGTVMPSVDGYSMKNIQVIYETLRAASA